MNIVFATLPGAHFADRAAIDTHARTATLYDNAVEAFELTGDEAELWEALRWLGFDACEIQQHICRPGWRMPQGYVVAG